MKKPKGAAAKPATTHFIGGGRFIVGKMHYELARNHPACSVENYSSSSSKWHEVTCRRCLRFRGNDEARVLNKLHNVLAALKGPRP